MPSNHDSAGRPIVVVTGLGVVTSLGAGKTDNWKSLTAGKSGIKSISRFATDGMKTRFAGCVDFVPATPLSAPELSERMADMAAEEAVGQSGVGSRGDFPGPLFIAVPPIEIEWTQRRDRCGEVLQTAPFHAGVLYRELQAARCGHLRQLAELLGLASGVGLHADGGRPDGPKFTEDVQRGLHTADVEIRRDDAGLAERERQTGRIQPKPHLPAERGVRHQRPGGEAEGVEALFGEQAHAGAAGLRGEAYEVFGRHAQDRHVVHAERPIRHAFPLL